MTTAEEETQPANAPVDPLPRDMARDPLVQPTRTRRPHGLAEAVRAARSYDG